MPRRRNPSFGAVWAKVPDEAEKIRPGAKAWIALNHDLARKAAEVFYDQIQVQASRRLAAGKTAHPEGRVMPFPGKGDRDARKAGKTYTFANEKFTVGDTFEPGNVIYYHRLGRWVPFLIESKPKGAVYGLAGGMTQQVRLMGRELAHDGWTRRKEAIGKDYNTAKDRPQGNQLGVIFYSNLDGGHDPIEGFTAFQAGEKRKHDFEQAQKQARQDKGDREDRDVGPWFDALGDSLMVGTMPDYKGAKMQYPTISDNIEAAALRKWFKEEGVNAAIKVRRYSMASGLDFGPKNSERDKRGGWPDHEWEQVERMTAGIPRNSGGILDHNRTGSGAFRVRLAYKDKLAHLLAQGIAKYNAKVKAGKGKSWEKEIALSAKGKAALKAKTAAAPAIPSAPKTGTTDTVEPSTLGPSKSLAAKGPLQPKRIRSDAIKPGAIVVWRDERPKQRVKMEIRRFKKWDRRLTMDAPVLAYGVRDQLKKYWFLHDGHGTKEQDYAYQNLTPAPELTPTMLLGRYDKKAKEIRGGWGAALVRHYLDERGISYTKNTQFVYVVGYGSGLTVYDIDVPESVVFPSRGVPKAVGTVARPAKGDLFTDPSMQTIYIKLNRLGSVRGADYVIESEKRKGEPRALDLNAGSLAQYAIGGWPKIPLTHSIFRKYGMRIMGPWIDYKRALQEATAKVLTETPKGKAYIKANWYHRDHMVKAHEQQRDNLLLVPEINRFLIKGKNRDPFEDIRAGILAEPVPAKLLPPALPPGVEPVVGYVGPARAWAKEIDASAKKSVAETAAAPAILSAPKTGTTDTPAKIDPPRKGRWTLVLTVPSSGTCITYTMHNPQGGSGGSVNRGTQKAAVRLATRHTRATFPLRVLVEKSGKRVREYFVDSSGQKVAPRTKATRSSGKVGKGAPKGKDWKVHHRFASVCCEGAYVMWEQGSGWINIGGKVDGKRKSYGWHDEQKRWNYKGAPPAQLLKEAAAASPDFAESFGIVKSGDVVVGKGAGGHEATGRHKAKPKKPKASGDQGPATFGRWAVEVVKDSDHAGKARHRWGLRNTANEWSVPGKTSSYVILSPKRETVVKEARKNHEKDEAIAAEIKWDGPLPDQRKVQQEAARLGRLDSVHLGLPAMPAFVVHSASGLSWDSERKRTAWEKEALSAARKAMTARRKYQKRALDFRRDVKRLHRAKLWGPTDSALASVEWADDVAEAKNVRAWLERLVEKTENRQAETVRKVEALTHELHTAKTLWPKVQKALDKDNKTLAVERKPWLSGFAYGYHGIGWTRLQLAGYGAARSRSFERGNDAGRKARKSSEPGRDSDRKIPAAKATETASPADQDRVLAARAIPLIRNAVAEVIASAKRPVKTWTKARWQAVRRKVEAADPGLVQWIAREREFAQVIAKNEAAHRVGGYPLPWATPRKYRAQWDALMVEWDTPHSRGKAKKPSIWDYTIDNALDLSWASGKHGHVSVSKDPGSILVSVWADEKPHGKRTHWIWNVSVGLWKHIKAPPATLIRELRSRDKLQAFLDIPGVDMGGEPRTGNPTGRKRRRNAEELGTMEIGADPAIAWKYAARNTYEGGDLPVIASREALQNGVDAIRMALNAKQITRGRFDVHWDSGARTLTFTDNGIGMDERVLRKFVTLGLGEKRGDEQAKAGIKLGVRRYRKPHGDNTGAYVFRINGLYQFSAGSQQKKLEQDFVFDFATKGAAGGFGWAKAVILGVSETFRWDIHTRNIKMDGAKVGTKMQPVRAPFRQGTQLRVYDISPKFETDYTFTYDAVLGKSMTVAERIKHMLGFNTLRDIDLYFNGKKVAPYFSGKRGAKIPVEVSDYATSAVAGADGYPFKASRDGLQPDARRALRRFAQEHERDEKVVRDTEDEVHDPEAWESHSGDYGQMANDLGDALDDPEIMDALGKASEVMGRYFKGQGALARDVVEEAEDLEASDMPRGKRVEQWEDKALGPEPDRPGGKTTTFGDASIDAKVRAIRDGKLDSLIKALEGGGASGGSPGIPLPQEVQDAIEARAQLIGATATTQKAADMAQAVDGLSEAVKSTKPHLSGKLQAGAHQLRQIAERGTVTTTDVQAISGMMETVAQAAVEQGGGGVAQVAAMQIEAQAILRDAAYASTEAKQLARRSWKNINPFGQMAGIVVKYKQFLNARGRPDKARARRFKQNSAKWVPYLLAWDACCRLIAKKGGIELSFKPGFILADKYIAMYVPRPNGRMLMINPHKMAAVAKAYRKDALSMAVWIHGTACHELAHMVMGTAHDASWGAHDEKWAIRREDLADKTAPLLPAMTLIVEKQLGLKAAPTRELERERARCKASVRAAKAKGRKRYTQAEAALKRAKGKPGRKVAYSELVKQLRKDGKPGVVQWLEAGRKGKR